MNASFPRKALVLGVGNILLSDEGVGVRVVERLQERYDLDDEVTALDGGTLGMDLLYYLEDADTLIIADAVEMGREPGCVLRLEGKDVPAYLSVKMSPHQVGVPDMLFAARFKGCEPAEVILHGVQPGNLDIGLELSEPVQAQVEPLVERIVAELRERGWQVQEKPAGSPDRGSGGRPRRFGDDYPGYYL